MCTSYDGLHRFGMPKFTKTDRSEFIRACRRCPSMLVGQFKIHADKAGGPTLETYVVEPSDLENIVISGSNPNDQD